MNAKEHIEHIAAMAAIAAEAERQFDLADMAESEAHHQTELRGQALTSAQRDLSTATREYVKFLIAQ